jgi:hypothetical protein
MIHYSSESTLSCHAYGLVGRPGIHDVIWYPEIPLHQDFIHTYPANRNLPSENVHFNMDFGGADGQRLNHLQRIVALIGDEPDLFVGLRFVYDDGETKAFNAHNSTFQTCPRAPPSIESSFWIDGSNGERVSAVTVVTSPGVESIEVLHTALSITN